MSIGETKKLGAEGVNTILFYLATTAIAITLALAVGSLINPGIGLDISSIEVADVAATEKTSLADTLLNIVPKNPIGALANGDMLPIILFALLIGIILAKLGERVSTVAMFFGEFNDVMMEMTTMVMKLAPYGVFCLIAKTFSGIGFSAFLPLLKYIFAVLLSLALQCFVVYMLFLKTLTGLNPFKFVRKFAPVMGFAFSTATSNATIPLSIDTLSEKMGVLSL